MWHDLQFLRVSVLYLIPLWIMFSLIYYFYNLKNKEQVQDICDQRLLPHIAANACVSTKWSRLSIYSLQLAVIISLIAFAGPCWRQVPRPLLSQDDPLVFVLDTSLSMDATDIKPSRLQRAKHKIYDILRTKKINQAGLVIFSQHAYVVTPITSDANTLLNLLNTVETNLMPTQGSRPDRAVLVAQGLLQQGEHKKGRIFLITDDMSELSFQGLKAIGSLYKTSILEMAQEDVPIRNQEGSLLRDKQGNIILASRHSERLKSTAHLLGGRYHLMTQDDTDIQYLLDSIESDLSGFEETLEKFDQYEDEGPFVLWFALPFWWISLRRKWN